MPLPCLSLMGFMQQQAALGYMQNMCMVADRSPQALRKQWQDAKQRLGAPMDRAGNPDIKPIPSDCLSYLNGVKAKKDYKAVFQGKQGTDWDFKLVEIAPLLAYQFHVIRARVAEHAVTIKDEKNTLELVQACLPQTTEPIALETIPQSSGLVVKSRESLNVSMGNRGPFQDPRLPTRYGIEINANVSLVQVMRYKGRCFLHNGYHRACALLESVGHIPCILREATEPWQTGVRNDGATFPEDAFLSADPPTCGHFAGNRAYAIDVRKASKIVTVTWSEGIIFDE